MQLSHRPLHKRSGVEIIMKLKLKLFFELLIVCLVIGMFVLIPNYNNYVLNKFSSQLFKIELPDNISLIDTYKIRGNLNGNGNTMDFFACILVKTNCSKEELQEFLENEKFTSAKGHKVIDTDVIKMKNNILDTKYVEHEQIVFESLKNENNLDDYYALIIYDGGYSSDFDLLGH